MQIGQIGRLDGTELLLKSVLVYHSPIFQAWKAPKRPVEVSCDVTQHLVEYRTAIGKWTSLRLTNQITELAEK